MRVGARRPPVLKKDARQREKGQEFKEPGNMKERRFRFRAGARHAPVLKKEARNRERGLSLRSLAT